MKFTEAQNTIADLIKHTDHTMGGTFVLHYTKGFLRITPTKLLPPDTAKIASITAFEIQNGLTDLAWTSITNKAVKMIEEIDK